MKMLVSFFKVKEGLQECDHLHQVYYISTNHIWMMKFMRAFGLGTWLRQVVDELAHT